MNSRPVVVPRFRLGEWTVILILYVFPFGFNMDKASAAASSSEFEQSIIEPLYEAARRVGVKEVYFLRGGDRFSEGSFGDCDVLVHANEASTRAVPNVICRLETGPNGLAALNDSMRKAGIEEGFIEQKLYVTINPKHVKNSAINTLIFERWLLDFTYQGQTGDLIVRGENKNPQSEPPISVSSNNLIAECYQLKTKYLTDGKERSLITQDSRVTAEKIEVAYVSKEPRGDRFVDFPGKFICYLNRDGTLQDNRELCVDGEDTRKDDVDVDAANALLAKYPWAKSELEKRLNARDTVAVLDDLNSDGLPELTAIGSQWCGSGGCSYPVFALDIATQQVVEIGAMGIDGIESILDRSMNGWKMLRNFHCANQCSCYLAAFDISKNQYVVRESYGGFDRWKR